MYAGLNQQLTQHQDDPNRGLSTSFSMSLADQSTNYMHQVYAASLRYRGLFDARPEDWIGFGLTWIDMSSQYARNQRYMNSLSGVSDYNDPAYHRCRAIP
jgi:porin